MPVERHDISVSQFCELLALDPARFIAVERRRRDSSTLTIVCEPEEAMSQTSKTFPQLTEGKGGKNSGGKKKGC